MSVSLDSSAPSGELRRRLSGSNARPDRDGDDDNTPRAEADESDDKIGSDPKPKKTFGRTPDGTIFTVPVTHDMVSQLLDPRSPKNVSDAIVLVVLAVHVLALYFLPPSLSRPLFATVFLIWRAAYNVGIGVLLRVQSNENKLVAWAKKYRLFEHPSTNPRPWLYNFVKREMECKIPDDYQFEKAPIEYNTWLVFRRLVDLILMCDFTSYCLYAVASSHTPVGESLVVTAFRWALGLLLVGFNLWVKLDAHRVVKDYAWYWGDFFYLVDQDLTFDGVFEMAPHPMYSIGYAGYYGISMMAASYSVLFISIIAHAAQFAFLVLVENPHIEKIYNPPPPRKRSESQSHLDVPASELNSSELAKPTTEYDPKAPIHNMLGLGNLDLFRNTDYTTILLLLYLVTLTVVTPQQPIYQALFFAHALLWRLWYTVGLGVILALQSENKMWTRHFVKYGESTSESWRQWKALYHISQVMCHLSFVAACWKMYSAPVDWDYGFSLLRHVIGAGLIALQVWTAVSIYDSLGEFGWFFGDFFFDRAAKLTYTSIYRFLNNPERIIGTAGLWGAALMTWSRSIFMLALTGHLLTLWFLHFVEQPHMQKIYGRKLREEAGLTKFIKKSLPLPVVEWSSSMNKVVDGTSHFVEDFLDAARPKLAAGVSTMFRDTTALFNKYPARLTLTRLSPDLAGLDPKNYSIAFEGVGGPVSFSAHSSAMTARASGKEGTSARFPQPYDGELKTLILDYGSPIRVKWTAPANHGKMDWIGLYMVADNRSREITDLSSLGRWVPTSPGQFESTTADRGILVSDEPMTESGTRMEGSGAVPLVRGEMEFSGDKLWWTEGVFEFRYHHDGKHNVMAISQPFEVHIGHFDEEDAYISSTSPSKGHPIGDRSDTQQGLYQKSVEAALLPVVQRCLDHDPEVAPAAAEDVFGSVVERDGKYAKRVVYAIRQMFGIDFAPAVVPADGSVRNLAWRISNAKQVLAPYSMSHSKGTTTPASEKME